MICLFRDEKSSSRYLEEILGQAGLSWEYTNAGEAPGPGTVMVIPGSQSLGHDVRGRVRECVQRGAGIVVVGGSAGLDEVIGATAHDVHEGYLSAFNPSHPITAGLPSPLHAFDASALRATSGTSLGKLRDLSTHRILGDSVVAHHYGQGATVALGADIAASVLNIQLGRKIQQDGAPAPDGTGPIDDGILKTDDGVVLSWEHDRIQTALAGPVPDCPGIDPAYPDGATPWFGRPVADELRTLLLQAIAWVASETGQNLALLAEWPYRLRAIGLISHDSDGNLDDGARTSLRLLDEAEINSTWCHIWSPAYSHRYRPATFAMIKQAGHEIALHYNALDRDGGAWGRKHLAAQAAYVRHEAGVDQFTSNKNHYLRWEGGTEFFHWLADEGIQVDQCKGPSKKGNVGYPHGSSLPWFPLDRDTGTFIDVMEIPLQFQDLWLTTPYYPSSTTIAQARRHRGVAHFLFHQIHLHTKPQVAQAMLDVIAQGREQGLDWWTSAQINNWQRRRRSASVTVCDRQMIVRTDRAVKAATIEVLAPRWAAENDVQFSTPSAELNVTQTVRWNQKALVMQLNLPAGETIITVRFQG
jgi:hypothetical protein